MDDKTRTFLETLQPKICVLATASKEGKPHCAVMGFALFSDGTLVFSTHTNSRKWQHLQENKNVSTTIGWDFHGLNLQVDGVASLIDKGESLQQTAKEFFQINPDAAKFRSPDTYFIKIRPTWIRKTDLSLTPPDIEESNLV